MSLACSRCRLLFLMPLAAAVFCGCAAMPLGKSKLPEPLTAERKAEVVAQFEAQREAAQLQAALNRWKEGNLPACEQILTQLIHERPQFVDARVQYAELLLARDDLAAAEVQLQEALRLAPQRADVHHCLALVLESTNPPAAAEHFRRATELEPENPLYRIALEH